MRRVLSFSYCFPNVRRPTWGIFVRQRLAALARRIVLEVVAPAPFFPFWTRGRGQAPERLEDQEGLRVHHPRFFYVPGILKNQDARFYRWGLRRWVGKLCASFQPDLLDAHFVWPDGVAVAGLARELGLPYVITLRGKIYPCVEVPSQRRQCARALVNADAVISVSDPMAELACELGVRRERMHVIPNGVDTERFRPRERYEARRLLGLGCDGPLIVAIGHLKPTKGHSELVRAVASVPQKPRLVIIGAQADCRGYEEALRKEIAALGLAGRVVLAGPQPYDRIPVYLAAADVSVLASYREGCPNVVLESLACGPPVVATRVGAVPRLVEDGGNGRIVPPRDAGALAEAIQDVLQRSWSAEALRNSPSVKTWDTVAGEVLSVFEGVWQERARC